METIELKKEQLKLAPRVVLNDGFERVKTIGGATCLSFKNKLLACMVVCEFPSLALKEVKTYWLNDPLPYHPGFLAYREMPALIEAYNQLEEEPDVLLVNGSGIIHPRRIGLASHLGLALNKSAIGVTTKLLWGQIEKGKIIFDQEICGFEITTKEHANPVYVSPGHLVTLGSSFDLVSKTMKFPHKMPEPIHLANKLGKKKLREAMGTEEKVSPVEKNPLL